jgi:cysteine desulfuration protein SufE
MINTLTKHAENLKTILELEGEEGQFEYLIDIGKKEGSLEPEEKIDKNKMSGCLAQVWIKFDTKNGKNYFDGDSDALIVKGLVKIIAEALSGLTNDEIKELKHDIVNKLGLGPSLSARRQVGMMSMVDHIKIITGAK